MPDARFLVLVPRDDEWHLATNAGRLVTTTERTQIPLGKIEGKRAPVIGCDAVGGLPSIDLTELITGQVLPAPAKTDPEGSSARDDA